MKSCHAPPAFLKWADIISTWLKDPSTPCYFESDREVGGVLFSLRQAIKGHLTYRHPELSARFPPDKLAEAWSLCKLTHVKDKQFCLCPTHFEVHGKPTPTNAVIVGGPASHSDSLLRFTTDDQDLISSICLLANAGLFSSNNTMVCLTTTPDLVPFILSQPDSYPNLGIHQADPLHPQFYLT